MARILTSKERMTLESMGYSTHKIAANKKRMRDLKMKRRKGKKAYYNA